jgi:anaerobic ribonucleoside-triphosphate reductase
MARCSMCNFPMASARSKCPNCGRDHNYSKDIPGIDRTGYGPPSSGPPGANTEHLNKMAKRERERYF